MSGEWRYGDSYHPNYTSRASASRCHDNNKRKRAAEWDINEGFDPRSKKPRESGRNRTNSYDDTDARNASILVFREDLLSHLAARDIEHPKLLKIFQNRPRPNAVRDQMRIRKSSWKPYLDTLSVKKPTDPTIIKYRHLNVEPAIPKWKDRLRPGEIPTTVRSPTSIAQGHKQTDSGAANSKLNGPDEDGATNQPVGGCGNIEAYLRSLFPIFESRPRGVRQTLDTGPQRVRPKHSEEDSDDEADEEYIPTFDSEELKDSKRSFYLSMPEALKLKVERWVKKILPAPPPDRGADDCWLRPISPKMKMLGAIQNRFTWTDASGPHCYTVNFGTAALFLKNALTDEQIEGIMEQSWHLSHLCGNWTCCNLRHFTVEHGYDNNRRNRCFNKGFPCPHTPRCLREYKLEIVAGIPNPWAIIPISKAQREKEFKLLSDLLARERKKKEKERRTREKKAAAKSQTAPTTPRKGKATANKESLIVHGLATPPGTPQCSQSEDADLDEGEI